MNYFLAALKKYAVFSGRAQRAEYWYFFLFNLIICIVVQIIGAAAHSATVALTIVTIYGLALILPSLAVAVRRLHDTNHSGGWWFINLVPLIGGIWFFVLTVLDSTPGDNKYGPNPKGTVAK